MEDYGSICPNPEVGCLEPPVPIVHLVGQSGRLPNYEKENMRPSKISLLNIRFTKVPMYFNIVCIN